MRECNHQYEFRNYCGARVCRECGDHKGLARCYCGWGLMPGERLEDDIGEGVFDGEGWDVDY
jgi:hypothetical protein